mmetsp:Transcript_10154/g.18227  ORF Transcript_10154/g.18227 Transcript_10154/m.18227 type:complete len:284 (+) Transcript_10154:609-1460(+)
MGQTGETFSGCAAYMRRHSPKLVICENVEGLAKKIRGSEPQVFSVMREFVNLGYSASWRILDSRHFQLPQRRRRCWMWASKYASNFAVENEVPDTLSRLASTSHVQLHKLLKKNMKETRLLDRERSVVKAALGKLHSQSEKDIIVDIAKSAERAPVCIGATSCIVPNSKPYHLQSKRVLTPEEVLKVQGIYREDFKALTEILKEKGGGGLARDLAGNAFTSTVCLAVLVSTLAHCPLQASRGKRQSQGTSPGTPQKRRRVADVESPIKSQRRGASPGTRKSSS